MVRPDPRYFDYVIRARENHYKRSLQNKKDWARMGELVWNKVDLGLHKESKKAAQRMNLFYSYLPGDWTGPFPREMAKMRESEFDSILWQRILLHFG